MQNPLAPECIVKSPRLYSQRSNPDRRQVQSAGQAPEGLGGECQFTDSHKSPQSTSSDYPHST